MGRVGLDACVAALMAAMACPLPGSAKASLTGAELSTSRTTASATDVRSTSTAVRFGDLLYQTCSSGSVQAFGLPDRLISESDVRGAAKPSEADLQTLTDLLDTLLRARMFNHHGSHMSVIRATALKIHALTLSIFGKTHFFATFTAECLAAFQRPQLGTQWNDTDRVNPIPASQIDLLRFVVSQRTAIHKADDPLVLSARLKLARAEDGSPAGRAQLDQLIRDLEVDPAKVESGHQNAGPLLSALRYRIREEYAEPQGKRNDVFRFVALARAKAIFDHQTPEDWPISKPMVNEYVPSSAREVTDAMLTADAVEQVYGPKDAVLAGYLYDLGEELRSVGRLDDARRTLTRAMTLIRAPSALPHPPWAGDESALTGYVAADLAMVEQQAGNLVQADAFFAQCLDVAKVEDNKLSPSACLLNWQIWLGKKADMKDYATVDRDMSRARLLVDTVLGADSLSWLDFGDLWAKTFHERVQYKAEAAQLRELIRRNNRVTEYGERLLVVEKAARIEVSHTGR